MTKPLRASDLMFYNPDGIDPVLISVGDHIVVLADDADLTLAGTVRVVKGMDVPIWGPEERKRYTRYWGHTGKLVTISHKLGQQ